MAGRQDALLAAARFVDMVNRVVSTTEGRQVGTVGRIQAFPGARNVIPGRVVLTLEVRDLDAAKIRTLYERIRGEAARIGEATGTTFAYTELRTSIPAPSDPRVRALIAASARELGLSSKVLPSGAGHDAQAIAQLGADGDDLHPERGRDQPLAQGVQPTGGHRERRERAAAHPAQARRGAARVRRALLLLAAPAALGAQAPVRVEEASVADLQRALRARTLSCRELVQAYQRASTRTTSRGRPSTRSSSSRPTRCRWPTRWTRTCAAAAARGRCTASRSS
jgi:hypothetical protein